MSNHTRMRTLHQSPAQAELLAEVLAGLADQPKHLPSKLFYDQRGSQLFDQICEQPEYYPTRTELSILEQYAGEMAELIGPKCRLIELGAGSTVKVRLLLDKLDSPCCFAPLDISGEHLQEAARALHEAYPTLSIYPIVTDYMTPFEYPDCPDAQRTVAFFPGSTIGNFTHAQAERFLQRVAEIVGEGGALLIGADLDKDPAILEPAYNDAAGVTAAFNLNLLDVLNEQFDAEFKPDNFTHRAVYVPAERRIEMRLYSDVAQQVQVADETFSFQQGEFILTEYSHKHTLESFAALAAKAGMQVEHVWRDDRKLFSVQYLTVAGS